MKHSKHLKKPNSNEMSKLNGPKQLKNEVIKRTGRQDTHWHPGCNGATCRTSVPVCVLGLHMARLPAIGRGDEQAALLRLANGWRMLLRAEWGRRARIWSDGWSLRLAARQ